MEQYALLTLLGLFIGILGTMIGVGGGFILVPLLLLLYPKDSPDTLAAISLTVTCANAISGTIAYIRMKRVNFKYGLIFSISSIPGAVFGAYLTRFAARDIFSLIFAVLLMIASIFIFFRSKPDSQIVEIQKINLSKEKLISGILISFLVGIISSFLGIGGGIIHVPVLSNILLFPVHIATATSHFILAITSFTGVVVHVVSGKFQYGMGRAAFIALGALVGAQFGAILSSKIKGMIIIRILAVALFVVGLRLLIIFFIK